MRRFALRQVAVGGGQETGNEAKRERGSWRYRTTHHPILVSAGLWEEVPSGEKSEPSKLLGQVVAECRPMTCPPGDICLADDLALNSKGYACTAVLPQMGKR